MSEIYIEHINKENVSLIQDFCTVKNEKDNSHSVRIKGRIFRLKTFSCMRKRNSENLLRKIQVCGIARL